MNVDYGDRLMANFHVNWLSPVKVRQMILAGSRKSLIFNELNPTEPVKLYDRGIEIGATAEDVRANRAASLELLGRDRSLRRLRAARDEAV